MNQKRIINFTGTRHYVKSNQNLEQRNKNIYANPCAITHEVIQRRFLTIVYRDHTHFTHTNMSLFQQ